jgi:hypothetical protein
VGERQPVGLELEVPEQEQVEVDRARAVARARERAPVLGLDRLADIEQGLGGEICADPSGRVQEVRLVEDLAGRLGLVQRRDGVDGDAVITEIGDGATEVVLAIAEVRAEADVADPLGPALRPVALGAQTPPISSSSSSSCSPAPLRSSVTSTAASSTR